MMELQDDASSRAFKRAHTNIHGKLKNYFLTHYSHFLVPGFNLSKTPSIDAWHVEDVMGLDQEFPYNCDFPKPLLPPVKLTKNVLNGGDPAIGLIATKTHIENDVKRILDHYQKHKNDFSAIPYKTNTKWKRDGGANVAFLPRYVADLAQAIEMDPDPYFAGMYNWYRTGGSLASLASGRDNLLIFPYADDLVATPIRSTKISPWRANLRSAASCKITDDIYETRVNTASGSSRILTRSRNKCVLYSLGEIRGKLRTLVLDQRESERPYVSADLHPNDPNKICTVDVERKLILCDAISCKSIASRSVEVSKVLEDKWSSARFANDDPNTIVFTDRCCLHYLDTRTRYERPVLTLCPKANLEACECLCMALPSCSDDHYYVASYHSLLICDRRSPKASVLQKWTHQFKSPPLLGVVTTRNERETIVLSSQIAGETAIILNNWDERRDNPHSYNLPYTPPSVLDTLDESRMQGKCLDPWLRKRLQLSNVGSCMAIDDNGQLSFFLQNSIGDVFHQCITHEEPLDKYSHHNCQSYRAMEAWERKILEHERLVKPLVMTNRTNMHHVFENLKNESLRIASHVEPNELDWDPGWKQSLAKLECYVDLLAPELLAVWDVAEENVPTTIATVPHEKVLNWLETAERKDTMEYPPPVAEIGESFFPASQQTLFSEIVEDPPREAEYPPVRVKTGRKPQPKKRTYVAGF